jgi:hypothetical protein
MDNAPAAADERTPWHLWVVGVAALLWYVAGALTIFMAQAGSLPDIKPDEAAYYAAQPFWFKALTDVATLAAVAGSVLLLRRSAKAVRAFGLSLAAIVLSQAWDYAMGTSRSFANTGALAVNCIIVVIAVLVFLYAQRLRGGGMLR